MKHLNMMGRIDFLGAPGVGKSTIYKALLSFISISTQNKKYYSEEEAILYSVRNYIRKNKNLEAFLIDILLIFRKIRNPYISSIEEKINKKIFEEFVLEHEKLFELVDRAYCMSDKSLYRKQYGYLSFNRKIRKYAILKECFPYIVIADESLSQKVYGVNPSECFNAQIIKAYFNTITVPNFLIHCVNDEVEVVNRILAREKTIPGHQGLTEAELVEKTKSSLLIAEIGAEILQQRGAQVIEVDTAKQVQENAIAIAKLIDPTL